MLQKDFKNNYTFRNAKGQLLEKQVSRPLPLLGLLHHHLSHRHHYRRGHRRYPCSRPRRHLHHYYRSRHQAVRLCSVAAVSSPVLAVEVSSLLPLVEVVVGSGQLVEFDTESEHFQPGSEQHLKNDHKFKNR